MKSCLLALVSFLAVALPMTASAELNSASLRLLIKDVSQLKETSEARALTSQQRSDQIVRIENLQSDIAVQFHNFIMQKSSGETIRYDNAFRREVGRLLELYVRPVIEVDKAVTGLTDLANKLDNGEQAF